MRSLVLVVLLALPMGVACSSSASPACDDPVATTTVDMQDVAFSPACVQAAPNATLQLVNHDDAAHTYTVKDTAIDVRLDGGASATAELTGLAPGTYSVVCTLHPEMRQTLLIS